MEQEGSRLACGINSINKKIPASNSINKNDSGIEQHR